VKCWKPDGGHQRGVASFINVARIGCGRNSVEHHQKLVAAQTAHLAGFSDSPNQPIRGDAKNDVARRMPVRAIDSLEVSEINI